MSHIIPLNEYVPIREGENFTVSFTSFAAPITKTRNRIPPNSSMSDCFGNWTDLSLKNHVADLKAYTIQDFSQILADNMTVKYNCGETLDVVFFNERNVTMVNSSVEYCVNGRNVTARTDESGMIHIGTDLPVGRYIVSLINPVNHQRVNVTLTIMPENNGLNNVANKYHPTHKNSENNGKYVKTYRVLCHNHVIYEGWYVTVEVLNILFNQNFTRGHMLVYLDGILVFNDTVSDDINRIVFEIISRYLGNHEIKVEFTDSENNTNTYTQNMTIT